MANMGYRSKHPRAEVLLPKWPWQIKKKSEEWNTLVHGEAGGMAGKRRELGISG